MLNNLTRLTRDSWPFIVIPLAVLFLFASFKWRAIEQAIAMDAQSNLKQANIEWANVESYNRGRDLLILGFAPDGSHIPSALSAAAQAKGARSVQFAGEIRNPSMLNLRFVGENIELSGDIKNQQEREAILAVATNKYGQENVIDNLSVNAYASTHELNEELLSSFEVLGDGDEIRYSNSRLALLGDVENLDEKENLQNRLASLYNGVIENKLEIAPAPIVEVDICQELVNALLNREKINFESGKAAIQENSDALISEIASTANRCPDVAFEVSGHTDDRGRLESNMRLSQRRAEAVVDRLTNLGLDADRFTAVGYGPNQPIVDNDSTENRALNRRIELKVQK